MALRRRGESSRRAGSVRGRAGGVVTAMAVAMAMVSGCDVGPTSGAGSSMSAVPADLLLRPDQLPGGFATTQLSVAELVAGNQAPIDVAKAAAVAPPECRPTADAELNPQLTAANSAVIAARTDSASLVELVTSARRDIESDVRVSTGRCATTTTVVGSGSMRGAHIVTRYTELPEAVRESSAVDLSLLLRSEVTTTLPDGAATTQVGYAAYAAVVDDGAQPMTVQLTAAGSATPAADPPTAPSPPMSDATFTALFGDAVAAATR